MTVRFHLSLALGCSCSFVALEISEMGVDRRDVTVSCLDKIHLEL